MLANSFGQRTLVQGTEEVRYGFTSREHDAETGLIYYRARTYDPATGSFLQRDPIGFASGDLNLYAYVENDPYNATDPSGLTTLETIGPGGSVQRDQANRTGISGIFSGALNLANAVRTTLVAGAAIATNAVLNQSGDDDGSSANPMPGTEIIPWVHGNSHQSQRGQELYYLIDQRDGSIQKIGIRGDGERRYSNAELEAGNVYLVVVQYAHNRLHAVQLEAFHIGLYVFDQAATTGIPSLPPQQVNFGR